MWRKIWKALDRAVTILFLIALPFFLYFLATELFRAQTPEDIFDLCYNHQMTEPKNAGTYSAAYLPLLTEIRQDLAVEWQLRPPFGNPEAPAQITDVQTDGDDLILKYDWKNGYFRLRPVDEDAINIRFQGIWDDDDGHGCAMLELAHIKFWETTIPHIKVHSHPYIDSIALGMSYNRDDVRAGWPIKITILKDEPKPQEKS